MAALDTRHICFDKDGTLTDVHTYWHHTCELRAIAVARSFGLSGPDADALVDAMGIDAGARTIKPMGPVGYLPRPAVVAAVVEYLNRIGVQGTDAGVNEIFADVDRRQQASNDYCVQVLPGVVEFLEYHSRRGTAMSVFSSDRRENTLRILASLGLDGYFATCVGGGCVRKSKPDPEGFLAVCAAVAVPPEGSAYVTDTVLDLQMAQHGQAGTTVGVATGLDTFDQLRASASIACHRLDELIPA